MNYIDWFPNLKASLQSWNKIDFFLDILSFYILVDLICYILFRIFTWVSMRDTSLNFSGFSIRVLLVSQNKFGSNVFLSYLLNNVFIKFISKVIWAWNFLSKRFLTGDSIYLIDIRKFRLSNSSWVNSLCLSKNLNFMA